MRNFYFTKVDGRLKIQRFFNNRFLKERGMASTPKMEYQIFLCIFQKNSVMATLGLKEMAKLNWDSQQGRTFYLPSQRDFTISFKSKVAIAGKCKKKSGTIYYEKWFGRHASFPPKQSVKGAN